MSDSEQWTKLINRLVTIIPYEKETVSSPVARQIAFRLGNRTHSFASPNYDGTLTVHVVQMITPCKDPFELGQILEALMNNVPELSYHNQTIKTVVNSSNCGIRLAQSKKGWLAFPAGNEHIDEAVISVLSFLPDKALKEYSAALEHFADGKWNEAAEKTRRMLEEYLRHLLSTNAGLETAIKKLGESLKSKGVPPYLIAHLMYALRSLDAFYNEISKHNSNTDETMAELTIYESAVTTNAIQKVFE